MSNKIDQNFKYEDLGLSVRLVNESDVDFILSLRTNERLSKFIHQTEDNRTLQLEWIKKYKVRESEGREYYFIYYQNGEPVGLNRIYNIYDYYGTIGSWICSPTNDVETSLATFIIMFDLLFEVVKLNISIYDVRKNNKYVLKLHRMLGAEIVGESDIDYYFILNKETYMKKRSVITKLLNLE